MIHTAINREEESDIIILFLEIETVNGDKSILDPSVTISSEVTSDNFHYCESEDKESLIQSE